MRTQHQIRCGRATLFAEAEGSGDPVVFLHAAILQSPYGGASLDDLPTYDRLNEIRKPALVMWGDRDFPHIQARSRQVVTMLAKGTGQALPGTAHLPSLDRPVELTAEILAVINRIANQA